MTWFLVLPDGKPKLDIEDLPMSAYVEVEAETGQKWYEVSGNPYTHAAGAVALMRRVLPLHGVEFPDPFPAKDFVKWFEWEDADSLPTGGTTDPVVEGSPSHPAEDAA